MPITSNKSTILGFEKNMQLKNITRAVSNFQHSSLVLIGPNCGTHFVCGSCRTKSADEKGHIYVLFHNILPCNSRTSYKN